MSDLIERFDSPTGVMNARDDGDYVEYREIERQAERIAKLEAALEKLARLGNGDKYGNSDGNMIARAALQEVSDG